MTGADRTPAILAIGVCSALGKSFAATARGYAAGSRGIANQPALVGADGLAPTLAEVIPLPECRDYDKRLDRLFDAALADLLEQAAPPVGGWPLRLVAGHLVSNAPAERFRASLKERHPLALREVELQKNGPAEALSALGYAAKAVLDGETDRVLVGALDSLIHPLILDKLAYSGQMLNRATPWGLIPGEAAVLMLVGLPQPDLSFLGHFLGAFRGTEPENVTAPKGLIGSGLATAMTGAAGFLAPDRLIVDLSGPRWRAEEFGFAVSRAASGVHGAAISKLAADPEAPALHFGDCGAAAGLLLPALAFVDPPGRARPGPVTLVSTGSRETGLRAVAFMERSTLEDGRDSQDQ